MNRTEELPQAGAADRERERRRLQAGALGWSAAQADAMRWADMGALHYDGRVYYRQDDPARAKRGRTVARSRVEALMSAGFLRLNQTDGRTVEPTGDGHAARRAWLTARPEPAEQESTALLPLLFGELEARQRTEAAARAEQRAEREALARRFTPAPEPEPAAAPSACDHERYVWLYLTADRITDRLGYHLVCACGQERRAYAGNSPAMNTGTATRPLGIADAGTEVAVFHADRCGYGVTGRWQVLDENTKRAPVALADAPLWPAVDDPNRRPAESVTAQPVTHTEQQATAEPAPVSESPAEAEQRRRDAVLNAELWHQPAEADALMWANMGHLHRDGSGYYRRDPADPRARSGRTVARARVEGLIRAGFLRHDGDHSAVTLTTAGHAAHRAFTALRSGCSDDELAFHRAQLAAHRAECEAQAAELHRAGDEADQQPATVEPAPAESVTATPVTETGGEDQDDDQDEDDPCNHVARWLYVAAEQPTRQLRAYLTCGCGRGGKLGNFNQRTATLAAGRTVAAVQTRTAEALADRNNYEITGAWEVLDEHIKRAAVRWTRARVPAAETVTTAPVTQTAAAAAAAADKDAAHAAWLDRHAERTGLLTIDGPGIVGPGTHITYRPGRGPGMRSKHGNHGTVVRISGTKVTWRPYGCRRTLRTPLADMRVDVPGTSATADAHGEAVAWRRWSLADHLAYTRRPAAPQEPAQGRTGRQEATGQAEPLQLPLWPAQVAPSTARRPAPASVTERTVTQTTGRPAVVAGVMVPLRPAAGPIVVVPCSGAKLDHRAEAGQLYTGKLYRAARKAADALTTAHGGTAWILSARHGFLSPRTVIEPYDQEWDKPGSISTDELRAQAARMGLHGAERVVLLTPAKYTARAAAVWPHAVAELAGLDIFGQRRRLAQLARTAQLPGRANHAA